MFDSMAILYISVNFTDNIRLSFLEILGINLIDLTYFYSLNFEKRGLCRFFIQDVRG